VKVTDAAGATATSLTIRVAKEDDGGGGGGGDCPLGDPQLCDILCQIQPDLPWCAK
jgi:thermitase